MNKGMNMKLMTILTAIEIIRVGIKKLMYCFFGLLMKTDKRNNHDKY